MNDLDALWAFLVAGVVAVALTPLTARLARRVGAVALPRDRDLHDRPLPRLGGLAILAGVLLASILFLPASTEMRGILAGAIAIALVGAPAACTPSSSSPASSPPRRSPSPATSASRTSRCRSSTRSTSEPGATR